MARFTVTDDLPTPPLPDATAITVVSESARANGISRSVWPPLSMSRRATRCSSLITPSSTSTPLTPGITATAAVTSRVRVSRIGQPLTVSSTRTRARPSASTSTLSTIPRSVIGRWISGSFTVCSAARILGVSGCSVVNSDMPPA